MKILKYKKLKNDNYELELENKKRVVLCGKTVLDWDLLLKKEIYPSDLKLMLEADEEEQIFQDILKFIGKKERSLKEIRAYLAKYDNNLSSKVIERLLSSGYYSEEKYIRAYINDKVNLSNWGQRKIYQALLEEEVDANLVLDYLNSFEYAFWQARIEKIIDKKLRVYQKYSNKMQRVKLEMELLNLGYDKQLICDTLAKLEDRDDGDLLKIEYSKAVKVYMNKYKGNDLKNKIIRKLMSKGFNYSDIVNLLEKNKKL